MGLDVCLTGPHPAPMTAQPGPLVAGHLAKLHRRNGVALRTGVLLDTLLSRDGTVTGVRLKDGDDLPAYVVVAAVGCSPATDRLTDSGLSLDDGVVCDAYCRAAEGVWAAGDVACWHHRGLGWLLRLENRTNATEQALAVAGDIVGEDRPYTPVPYFWTDQFDVKLQVFGLPSAMEELGLRVTLLRLLVVDWVAPHGPWNDQLAFVFDGGTLDEDQADRLRPRDDELSETAFVTAPEATDRLRDRTRCRFEYALQSLDAGRPLYLRDGTPPCCRSWCPARRRDIVS